MSSKPSNVLREPVLTPHPYTGLYYGCRRRKSYESGGRLDSVYFPTTSIVALLYTMENGSMAEMGLVGNDTTSPREKETGWTFLVFRGKHCQKVLRHDLLAVKVYGGIARIIRSSLLVPLVRPKAF
jgi:hypothetical protein